LYSINLIPEAFIQYLARYDFYGLALSRIRHAQQFRPIACSDSHLKNKLHLKQKQAHASLGKMGDDIVDGSLPIYSSLHSDVLRYLDRHHSLPDLNINALSQQGDNGLWAISLACCDDICLMIEQEDSYALIAASVCAPSGWSLAKRLGSTLAILHAPIPKLNRQVGKSIQVLLSRLSSDKCYQRFNWGLKPAADLAIFPGQQYPQAASLDDLFLRIERQTLSRISSKAIIFSIDVTTHHLSDVRETQPEVFALLAKAVQELTEPQRNYKGIGSYVGFFK